MKRGRRQGVATADPSSKAKGRRLASDACCSGSGAGAVSMLELLKAAGKQQLAGAMQQGACS